MDNYKNIGINESIANIGDENSVRYDYMSASDVAAFLGIGRTKAYEICKDINSSLARKGYLVFKGKIPRSELLSKLPQ